MTIITMSTVVFFTQILFIGTRNWNVKAVANDNLPQILLSGTVVHLSWLLSVTLGVTSAKELVQNWDLSYIPVILCSLCGGLIGSYLAVKIKLRKK
tara:strand:- start:3918 stop:4205 length:288 start_codon:yes stop_codon:yes gene_type:complete